MNSQAVLTVAPAPHCVSSGCPDLGIYVACLASYNEGLLFGYWLDLEVASDVEDIWEGIRWVISQSPTVGAEEWAIHDNSGLPSCLSGEWPDIKDLAEFAGIFNDLFESEQVPYVLACNNQSAVLSEDTFRDSYHGMFDSVADFCISVYVEGGDIEQSIGQLSNYIDWDRVWHGEFECNSWHSEFGEGGYYIFSSF